MRTEELTSSPSRWTTRRAIPEVASAVATTQVRTAARLSLASSATPLTVTVGAVMSIFTVTFWIAETVPVASVALDWTWVEPLLETANGSV